MYTFHSHPNAEIIELMIIMAIEAIVQLAEDNYESFCAISMKQKFCLMYIFYALIMSVWCLYDGVIPTRRRTVMFSWRNPKYSRVLLQRDQIRCDTAFC